MTDKLNIKIGDKVRIAAFDYDQHLKHGAVIKPSETREHQGYTEAIITGLFQNEVTGEVSVEVAVPGGHDEVPASAVILDDVMTSAECAAEFNIDDSTVRKAIERGNIPARQSGKTWIVRRADAVRQWGQRDPETVSSLRQYALSLSRHPVWKDFAFFQGVHNSEFTRGVPLPDEPADKLLEQAQIMKGVIDCAIAESEHKHTNPPTVMFSLRERQHIHALLGNILALTADVATSMNMSLEQIARESVNKTVYNK